MYDIDRINLSQEIYRCYKDITQKQKFADKHKLL